MNSCFMARLTVALTLTLAAFSFGTRRLLQRKRIDENSLREAAQNAHLNRQRTVELGDVFVWKTPRFSQTPGQVKDMIEKVKKRKTVVLDLRGNGGGYVDTFLALVKNVSTVRSRLAI